MTWHYVAVRKTSVTGEPYYHIEEVYREEDGRISGYTMSQEGMAPIGATQVELISTLQMMIADAEKWPVMQEVDEKLEEVPLNLLEADDAANDE